MNYYNVTNKDFKDFYKKLCREIKSINKNLTLNLFDFDYFEWFCKYYESNYESKKKFEHEFGLRMNPKETYLIAEVSCGSCDDCAWDNMTKQEEKAIAGRIKESIKKISEKYFNSQNPLSSFKNIQVKVLTKIYDFE